MNEDSAAFDSSQASSPSPPAGFSLVALISGWGSAPPQVSDTQARAEWAIATSLWHPALLRASAVLPSAHDPATLTEPTPHTRIIARADQRPALPIAPDQFIAVESSATREQLAREILERLEIPLPRDDANDPLVADFFALGTAALFLRELITAMNQAEVIEQVSLTREVLSAAQAWHAADEPTARNHLRAAFEILTQSRERIYPVDNYLIDCVLLDAAQTETTTLQAIAHALEQRIPFTLIATGRALESLTQSDPDFTLKLVDAVDHGWLDLAGGPYDETPEPLMPVESILWQYEAGARAYESAFEGRNVETFARRGFGLYPMLPQVLRRFGLRFGYHVALDGGHFPIPRDTKRLWESPDGASVEVLCRPPLTAQADSAGREFPWRLARTLKEDHVATLPLVHWPTSADGWFEDLRRSATFAPVFGRWVTLGDFFQRSDKPWEPMRTACDDYESHFLAREARESHPSPITRHAKHARLRARADTLRCLSAIHALLQSRLHSKAPEVESLDQIERALESHQYEVAEHALDSAAEIASQLARGMTPSDTTETPGFLVINSLPWPRRVGVVLPDADIALTADGPLKAAQFTEYGVVGVVETPGLGFVWVPAKQPAPPPETPKLVRATGHVLSNGILELEIDPKTGGIRSVQKPGEPTPRLAQQLSIRQPHPTTVRMIADHVEIEYGGPALAQAITRGHLIDESHPNTPRARFQQRIRLWAGRPIAELNIELTDIDPQCLASLRAPDADPWQNAIACRWAWADAAATLRRGAFLGAESTKSQRLETPDFLEISNRGQKSAILFGGIPYHQRSGPRMADTLLIAGHESTLSFDFGIVLDLEYPAQAALDFITPATLVPVANPPASARSGWFFHSDMHSVAITRLEYVSPPANSDLSGALRFHLLETGGRSVRGKLKCFIPPKEATQVDMQGERIVDLDIDGEAIQIDLAPRELACVRVLI